MTILEHVGARIHLYRKLQHLTLEQLAHLIHKTPSTVCKYEQGKIAVDVATLQEISEVLNVSLAQLVDYHTEKDASPSDKADRGFFSLRNRYYMYQYFIPKKDPVLCVIEIIPGPTSADDRIMFYYDVDTSEEYTSANFIYQ